MTLVSKRHRDNDTSFLNPYIYILYTYMIRTYVYIERERVCRPFNSASNHVSEYSYIYLFIGPWGPWTNMITYLSGWTHVAFHPILFHRATLAICKDGQRWNKDGKHGPQGKDHALVRLKRGARFKRFVRFQCFEPHSAEDTHSNLKAGNENFKKCYFNVSVSTVSLHRLHRAIYMVWFVYLLESRKFLACSGFKSCKICSRNPTRPYAPQQHPTCFALTILG